MIYACLAQSIEHKILNLGVVCSSPTYHNMYACDIGLFKENILTNDFDWLCIMSYYVTFIKIYLTFWIKGCVFHSC